MSVKLCVCWQPYANRNGNQGPHDGTVPPWCVWVGECGYLWCDIGWGEGGLCHFEGRGGGLLVVDVWVCVCVFEVCVWCGAVW